MVLIKTCYRICSFIKWITGKSIYRYVIYFWFHSSNSCIIAVIVKTTALYDTWTDQYGYTIATDIVRYV